MTLLEISVIVFASLIVVGVVIMTIIRKRQGKTSCGCDCSACKTCGCCEKDKKNIDHKH